jgi:hypothetical protein
MSSNRSTKATAPDVELAGAHADYRRSDYYFDRTQSAQFRDLPWEHRRNQREAWTKLAGITITGVAIAATLACTLT